MPYDTSISPVDNMYNNPNDLDPQPEFPMRTELEFFREIEVVMPDLEVLESDLHPVSNAGGTSAESASIPASPPTVNNYPSFATMFLLWIIGLLGWGYFALRTSSASKPSGKQKKTSRGRSKDK